MDRLSLSSHGHDAASSARALYYVTSDRKEIGRACTEQTGSIGLKIVCTRIGGLWYISSDVICVFPCKG